jgi:hypothetical protein
MSKSVVINRNNRPRLFSLNDEFPISMLDLKLYPPSFNYPVTQYSEIALSLMKLLHLQQEIWIDYTRIDDACGCIGPSVDGVAQKYFQIESLQELRY